MAAQIRILLKLQIANMFGLNVLRHSKDKRKRSSAIMTFVAWIILLILLFFYMLSMAYAFIGIGMGDVLPLFLVIVSVMIVFFFAMLRTGAVIFRKSDYDTLCSLPVTQSAVVISRYISMYLEDLILTAFVMIPGLGVYAASLHPGFSFYLFSILGILLVPMLPVALASLLGTAIAAVSSRMKHKSIFGAVFTILVVIVIFALSYSIPSNGSESTAVFVSLIDRIGNTAKNVYPPAYWLNSALVNGDIWQFLLFLTVSLACTFAIVAVISKYFHVICRNLFAAHAKHDYSLSSDSFSNRSVLSTLLRREIKHYFSSGVYISNTIIGPIMCVIGSIALLVAGIDRITASIALSIDIPGVIPVFLSAIFSMLPSYASVSLEGRQWWMIKALPLRTRDVINSKLLMCYVLYAPFYIISVILLLFALKPDFLGACFLIAFPIVAIVFSSVFGLAVNLRFPVFDWDNEAVVVKQSTAALIGGMGGFLIMLLCAALILIVNSIPGWIIKLSLIAVLLTLSALIYRKLIKTDLLEIE